MTNREEIERRRTFAIISHPDAGKTTLTEKLLLYGGAINQAGSVKGKQSAKHAVSDWMDIEKQRGISVTSSVLQFNYAGKCVNILDTPGHQDFSEDTYRTLMAADSAVMVIDAAKGVEAQTIKLFKVCTLRHIPIFTFINKMDREARDPFELMENIEEILGIKTYPMNWPIGCGKEFKGVFDRNTRKVLAFSSDGRANGVKKVDETEAELGDPALDELLTPYLHQQLVDEIELLDGAAEEFDLDKVLKGELSPVFFGSALRNFGVRDLILGEAADIVQADGVRAGGYTEMLKIAALTQAWNLKFAPHAMEHMHCHLVSAVPNALFLERLVMFEDITNALFRNAPVPENGFLPIADAPGLGLTLDMDFIRDHDE